MRSDPKNESACDPGRYSCRAGILAIVLLASSIHALDGAEVKDIDTREVNSQYSDGMIAFPPARGLGFEPEGFREAGYPSAPDPADAAILAIIAEALRWRGVPYAYGGSTVSGADCSGYVEAVLAKATGKGRVFPRSSGGYATLGEKVSGPIHPGDILVFSRGGEIYHVGIALSETSFIHSASEGDRTGVIISTLDEGNWRRRLAGVRRLSR